MPTCINATISIIKNLQYNFPKFIRFGSWIRCAICFGFLASSLRASVTGRVRRKWELKCNFWHFSANIFKSYFTLSIDMFHQGDRFSLFTDSWSFANSSSYRPNFDFPSEVWLVTTTNSSNRDFMSDSSLTSDKFCISFKLDKLKCWWESKEFHQSEFRILSCQNLNWTILEKYTLFKIHDLYASWSEGNCLEILWNKYS